MQHLKHLCGALTLDAHGKASVQRPLSPDEEMDLVASEVADIDPKALAAALQDIRAHAERDALRKKNIAITKASIRKSVTFDAHIIHAMNTIEEIDRVANTLAKRLRGWEALDNPELEHAQRDHRAFVRALLESKTRSEDSMGAELSDEDRSALHSQAHALEALYAQRDALLLYMEKIMQSHTPNVLRVAGGTIGAKLLALSGSLERLARLPSGTVQLLGAETALFRHLKNRSARPPKHGVIFNHQLLQRSPKEKRGKAARAIADAVSIAARVDFFKGEFCGDMLVQRMEKSVRR